MTKSNLKDIDRASITSQSSFDESSHKQSEPGNGLTTEIEQEKEYLG